MDDSVDKIDRSLTLPWPMLDHNQFFICFMTEKERSPSVFATGSVRYSCIPAFAWDLLNRGAPTPWPISPMP
jgi:hypothetical protein